ncbi:MAG: Gfo/Idh/MocA family oxidoreductase [Deferribacteres bacterium]|nr:Gfo/Idh/MocA family oxidoreductase [candidate division KSB1 bacterium]MCB9508829.1 Gfo/Idh/MocA family oxidoreductase [Deferribacteres bacterium]
MNKKIKVLVLGCGNMGASHARAYHKMADFELCGLIARTPKRRTPLAAELGGVAEFDDFGKAIAATQPDAVAICTYPDSHYKFAQQALNAGLHIFMEKPLAETVAQAQGIVELAAQKKRKVVVGYILRHNPAWIKFVEIARTLGKPLVMRMNLNQQSSGAEWQTHKQLMQSMSPIVDCGVHYVDIMCQMTRSKPVLVQAIGARLSEEIDEKMYNYGQLQVRFEDDSVGWYEAGWGPMMSETAFFVKDVIGPKGCVSIVDPGAAGTGSADIDAHTKTNSLLQHHATLDANGELSSKDVLIDTRDEPGHQELCDREQAWFLQAIRDDLDLSEHLSDAVNSLRIVLAADESLRSGQVVRLQ